MQWHHLIRLLRRGIFPAVLLVLIPAVISAQESQEQQSDIFYSDVIDTLEVIDQLDEHSKGRIREKDIEFNPACLYQDVYKHALATQPLINAYGPFSAQLSVNGLRPGDVSSRVDNILTLYKKDSYHNLFSLPRTDIFKTRLDRHGFPTFELTTDPKEGHGVSLGLLDFSAFSNLRISHIGCFNLVRVSWLDQVMRRLYDEEYSVFPSFEEYYLKIQSDAPGNLGPELNVWFVDQDSYFETSQFDEVIEERKEAYHTSARWKSNSRSLAGWYRHHLLVKDSFIRTGWSLSYTRREDLAKGKSGLVSTEPTDLDSHLYFLTLNANAILECFTYTKGLEIQHGINVGKLFNRMKVDSQGMYYPSIYVLQRGDEYTPDKLMEINLDNSSFYHETWLRIKKDISRMSLLIGLNGLYRDRFPFALGPECEIDYVSGIGKVALVLGRGHHFPGAERAHVSMYPLEGSRVEVNDSFTISYENSLLQLSGFYSRLHDLFDPVDENSSFRGDYADGYACGFECILKKEISLLDIHIGYGYGRSMLKREGISYPSTYDPGSKGTCALHFRLCDSIRFSLAGDCSQGQRITPLLGRKLTESGYQPVWGRPNAARLPLNWGVSAGTAFKVRPDFEVSLFATDIPGRRFAIVYEDWQKKNFVKTHWFGGLKVGYDF